MTPRFVIYLLLVFTATTTGIIGFRKLSNPFRILTILLGVVFVSECMTRVFVYYISRNSYLVYHILVPVEIVFYFLIYFQLFKQSNKLPKAVLVLAIMAFCLSILNTLQFQSLLTFPSYSVLALSTFLVCCTLLQFFFMLNNPLPEKLVMQPVFWFNLGNLFFYSMTFFIFGFFNPLRKIEGKLPAWEYYIIWASNMIMYGSYLIAIYVQMKQTEKETNV